MSKVRKKIILISGDPNSINTEIIYKTWKKLNLSIRKKILVIGNYNLLKDQFRQLKYPINLKKIENINEKNNSNHLKIIDIKIKYNSPFNVKKKHISKYVLNSLNLGHKLALSKDVAGLINCPVNKNIFNKKNIGVTEYLASKCKIKDKSEVMLINNEKLSVCPITTHLDIKNVSKNIKSKLILIKIKTIQKWYFKFFKKKPKFGILGLNPHNAELKFNSEEKNEIIPAITKLKKQNYDVAGPLVSDTIFIKDFKNYNILIGMYHDQVLSPFKAIFGFNAINITMGLKYLRVSPDHGIAVDLIKKNKANPLSLLQCVKFVNKF